MTTKRAGDVDDGEFFRKPQGAYVYLKVSDSSVRYFNLYPAFMYGIAYNGDIARLDPSAVVIQESYEGFLADFRRDERWLEHLTGRCSPKISEDSSEDSWYMKHMVRGDKG